MSQASSEPDMGSREPSQRHLLAAAAAANGGASVGGRHHHQLAAASPSAGGGGNASSLPPSGPHRVALVSDFFYPGFGGVEIHIYNVAQCLMRRGHKVIVITRAYGDRNGIRYLTNGLKVYYLPFVGVQLPPGTVTLPTLWGGLPLLRDIFLRERISIVHGHQTTSNLCHEALFHAGLMGLKVCFTDHSLFGFADAASIHINKVLQWSLCCVDQVICVSNTSRENTVLRAKIPPSRVSVIPNATDTASFTPPDAMKYRTWAAMIRGEGSGSSGSIGDAAPPINPNSGGRSGGERGSSSVVDSPSKPRGLQSTGVSPQAGGQSPGKPAPPMQLLPDAASSAQQQKQQQQQENTDQITIVVITRLVYRKGADLFVDVIPEICSRYPNVRWVVGGDGPRRPQLEQMIDKHNLSERVKMLGELKHADVKHVLNQGQIFLNCSLTEAFCIALIEAASCGLLCVSTGVGGVPEVLPPDMLLLAQPEPSSILAQLEAAIARVAFVSPWEVHDAVRKMYSWDWVAERTERVYERIAKTPPLMIHNRFLRYMSIGRVYGALCVLFCAVDWMLLKALECWLHPAEEVAVAKDFPVKAFLQRKDKLLQPEQ